jgi:hypothetical protein
MTTAHVTPLPDPTTGVVTLRLSTSGDEATSILLYRRIVGEATLVPVILPAAWLEPSGGIRPIAGQASFDDTCAPLDIPVEYLAAIDGADPVLVSDEVTLINPGGWWLGDPLRPQLNLALVLRRSITACDGVRAVFLSTLGDEEQEAVGELTAVAGQAYRLHDTQPLRAATSGLVLATKELADMDAVHALLDPGGVLLLRAPASPDYGFSTRYCSVREVTKTRLVPDARVAWRRWELPYELVEAPAGGAYGATGTAWGDLCDAYATYALMAAAGDLSWTSIVAGVATGRFPAAYRTCAEVSATWATCAALAAAGLSCLELVTGV